MQPGKIWYTQYTCGADGKNGHRKYTNSLILPCGEVGKDRSHREFTNSLNLLCGNDGKNRSQWIHKFLNPSVRWCRQKSDTKRVHKFLNTPVRCWRPKSDTEHTGIPQYSCMVQLRRTILSSLHGAIHASCYVAYSAECGRSTHPLIYLCMYLFIYLFF